MTGNVLSVSWSRYQELVNSGHATKSVYRDERGIAWTLAVQNPVFDTPSQVDEAKVADLMRLIESQRK
jgi:hypothetical protein